MAAISSERLGAGTDMEYEFIALEVDNKVATLRLARPPRHLLNITMLEEINGALLSLRQFPELEVLVVRGADGNFCEGIDLKDHNQRRVQRLIQLFTRVFELLRMTNVISVAAVEGHAFGGGFELALGCNMIVAMETTVFALPQIKQGVIPAMAAAILPRVAPRRLAMEWILMGNAISATRLAHDGVVNRLFEPEHFERRLGEFVSELTEKSGPVLQLAKRAQMQAYYTAFPEAMANIQSLYLKELMALHDAREGPRAAREEREPVWKNC
jgi:enoyl-CoA hydratase/carnithine racemase